ncbi:hypothetical protein GCM10029992_17450 [Glycomyces albus]
MACRWGTIAAVADRSGALGPDESLAVPPHGDRIDQFARELTVLEIAESDQVRPAFDVVQTSGVQALVLERPGPATSNPDSGSSTGTT